MKKNGNSQKKKYNLYTIIVVFIILTFHDSLAYAIIPNENMVKISLFILFVSLTIICIIRNKIKINKIAISILATLIGLLIINMIINLDLSGGYFVVIMAIIIAFLAFSTISTQDFFDTYVNTIAFLSFYSLIIYIFRGPLIALDGLFPTFINSANNPFVHFGFSVYLNIPGYNRIFGLFRESGVFVIYLNIALFLSLYLKNLRYKKVKIILIIMTIIFTFSTPGYIASVLIFIAYFLNESNHFRGKKIKIFLLVLLVFCLSLLGINSIVPTFFLDIGNVFNKLLNRESSYIGRTTSIFIHLRLWIERPILGHGIINGIVEATNIGSELLGGEMHNTSTFTAALVNFGLIFSAVIITLFVNFFLKLKINKISIILIVLSVLLVYTSQLMIYSPLIYVISFYGIKNNYEIRGNKNEKNFMGN